MDTLIAILRAAHCKSTHHYFAIDSLSQVSTSRGHELADLLLAHYGDYLKGAKDPDNVFKDFENHVIHVADGYWGGAAKAGKKWLDASNRLLSTQRWSEAAYSIGVLSHYFTDPFMPLHTAQSPRETAIHRPLEWSVCCSYQEIYESALSDSSLDSFEIPAGAEWITDAIHRGAKLAHQYYELLLDDYDMNEASRFPKLALGTNSKRALAQLFVSVQTAWGGVLDRIAYEATNPIPKFSLTLPTLLAGIQIPTKKIVQAIESAERRKEVQSIIDEYQSTGKVVRNLPIEQRTVQTVRREKPDLRPAPMEIERMDIHRIEIKKPTDRAESHVSIRPRAITPPPEIEAAPTPLVRTEPVARGRQDREQTLTSSASPVSADLTETEPDSRQGRKRLRIDSPIVDAPAIGPKTAARFNAIGCNTIEDFLRRDADQIANELNTQWIDSRLVSQWQDQSRLACQIDRLTAAGAGLLVIAGIHSAEKLAEQDPVQLHALLETASQTNEGKRLIRDQGPPAMEAVERWITSARKSTSAIAPVN